MPTVTYRPRRRNGQVWPMCLCGGGGEKKVKNAVVDFAAFVNAGKGYIVKELSITGADSKISQNWIFISTEEQRQQRHNYSWQKI